MNKNFTLLLLFLVGTLYFQYYMFRNHENSFRYSYSESLQTEGEEEKPQSYGMTEPVQLKPFEFRLNDVVKSYPLLGGLVDLTFRLFQLRQGGNSFVNPFHVLFQISWVLFIGYVFWSYPKTFAPHTEASEISLKKVFNRRYFSHKSFRADVWFFTLDGILGRVYYPLTLGVAFFTLDRWLFSSFLTLPSPFPEWIYNEYATVLGVGFIVLNVFVYDFASFLTHYMNHKVPFLWELHRVHHSAEVLSPMTSFRDHPLIRVWIAFCIAFQWAVYKHIFEVLFPGVITSNTVLVGSLIIFLMSYPLLIFGHFPVPISYGWVERHLISPRLHSVHHSMDPKHFDKNFAGIFSYWDRMFGSYYQPTEEEVRNFRFGQDLGDTAHTLQGMVVNPLKESWKAFKKAAFDGSESQGVNSSVGADKGSRSA